MFFLCKTFQVQIFTSYFFSNEQNHSVIRQFFSLKMSSCTTLISSLDSLKYALKDREIVITKRVGC